MFAFQRIPIGYRFGIFNFQRLFLFMVAILQRSNNWSRIKYLELKFRYMRVSYSRDPTIRLFQINNLETQK